MDEIILFGTKESGICCSTSLTTDSLCSTERTYSNEMMIQSHHDCDFHVSENDLLHASNSDLLVNIF